MQLSQVNFSAIALAPFASAKGVKTAACTIGGAPCEFLLHDSEWFSAPFGASAFNAPDAVRLNLELDVTTSSVLPTLQVMEQEVIRRAHAA